MNCYFTWQKLSKFSKTCFTTTKETALASFNLAHLVGVVCAAVDLSPNVFRTFVCHCTIAYIGLAGICGLTQALVGTI